MADKHIKPLFPIWCQKILPLVYDESLSYYENLCRFSAKLSEIIKSQNNLQDEFYQLKDWIDTQLETYSKEQLEEWLDDGTLENLFKNIFSLYNNVQDMINDINIKENNLCVTLGYYEVNDKGFNTWYVSKSQPASGYYVQLSNGLYAIRNNTGNNNIMQFGVKADLEEPQQSLIQKAIDDSEVLYFNEGVYFVNLATPYSLNCHDNLNIIGNNTTIKGIGSYDNSFYTVLAVANKNVTIKNIKIDGAKELVTVVGEHGMGSTITGENVLFENVEFQNCFGDGAIIDKQSKNIIFDNCYFHDCRRQGISICGCNGVIISNCIIENIKGTAPSDGIDIEPYEDVELTNIIIENTKISNCDGFGIQTYLENLTTYKNTIINVENVMIDSCSIGLHYSYINQGITCSNKNIYMSNMKNNYIVLRAIPNAKKLLKFENVTIYGDMDNAILLDGTNGIIDGVIFDSVKTVALTEPWNRNTVVFTIGLGIKNIDFINTNISNYVNWNLVQNLYIDNEPLVVSTDITLDFSKGLYYKYIYVDSNSNITWSTIRGNSNISYPSPSVIIKLMNDWNCTIINSNFVKNNEIIGTTGISITDGDDSLNTTGAYVEIQPIRNKMAIVNMFGNWKARN